MCCLAPATARQESAFNHRADVCASCCFPIDPPAPPAPSVGLARVRTSIHGISYIWSFDLHTQNLEVGAAARWKFMLLAADMEMYVVSNHALVHPVERGR